ncbi:MAG: tetratricopeptide repeat protein [Candidatus Omnitrophica bacterium]|nr:tetratricopeptide repeat protein [Candidatus Omnitrophota bacterium]
MRDKKNKFMALILGIISSLFLLEIILRITGFIHLHEATRNKIIHKEENSYTILCLGDSLTFGIGAQKDKNFPRQLENLLNKGANGKQIKVINRGIGGQNTAMILDRFEDYIDEMNPDLIILLAGGANFWNPYGYGRRLHKEDIGYKLQDYLYSTKIFKLIKLLSLKIENKTKQRYAPSIKMGTLPEVIDWNSKVYGCKLEGGYEEAISRCREIIEKTPNFSIWCSKASECEREGKYKEAILWNKKMIEKMPNFAIPYHSIGRIYIAQGNRTEARKYFRKAIEYAPWCPQFYSFFALYFVRDPVQDQEDLQFLEKYINVNPIVKDIIAKTFYREKYDQEIGDWVALDISSMIQISQKRGVKILVQNYPNYDGGGKRAYLNMILKGIVQKYPVPFVDNERAFQEIFLNGEKKEDYFVIDRTHCNEKGYGIVAENIYNCIQEDKLIK